MPEQAAILFWCVISAYAAIGALVALWLTLFSLKDIDKNAAAAPFGIKLLLAPGLVALWPLMLMRAFRRKPREDAE